MQLNYLANTNANDFDHLYPSIYKTLQPYVMSALAEIDIYSLTEEGFEKLVSDIIEVSGIMNNPQVNKHNEKTVSDIIKVMIVLTLQQGQSPGMPNLQNIAYYNNFKLPIPFPPYMPYGGYPPFLYPYIYGFAGRMAFNPNPSPNPTMRPAAGKEV